MADHMMAYSDTINYDLKDEQEKRHLKDMMSRLRGIDPDLDDMLEALITLKNGSKRFALNANMLMEYGLLDNSAVIAIEKKRLEMQAIINSNKDINTLLEAVMLLKAESD